MALLLDFTPQLTTMHLSGIFKVGFITIEVLFAVFLVVILKQVQAMNKVVTQPYLYPFLFFFALGMILCALALIALSVVIL